jgi:outer membrane lipoprotein-sorting protein
MTTDDQYDVVRLLGELAKLDAAEETVQRALAHTRSALMAVPPHRRAGWRMRSPRVALAAGLLLAAGVWGLTEWRAWPGNSTFAAVQETMTHVYGVTFQWRPIRVSGAFSSPEKIMLLDEHRSRTEDDKSIAIIDSKQRRMMQLDLKEKTATMIDNMDFPPRGNDFDLIRNLKQGKVKQLPNREINGKPMLCFRARDDVGGGWNEERILLVDPATQLPVRIERTVTNAQGKEMIFAICDDFRYNVTLDESLFALTPPAGYRVTTRRQEPLPKQVAGPAKPISPEVRLEVRVAEDEPGAGLTEMTYGSPRSHVLLYLHGEVELSNPDFQSVSVSTSNMPPAQSPGGKQTYDIIFRLTPAGGTKMASLTSKNRGKQLVILVDGNVLFAARLRSEISDNFAVSSAFSKDDAERIVDGLQKK